MGKNTAPNKHTRCTPAISGEEITGPFSSRGGEVGAFHGGGCSSYLHGGDNRSIFLREGGAFLPWGGEGGAFVCDSSINTKHKYSRGIQIRSHDPGVITATPVN